MAKNDKENLLNLTYLLLPNYPDALEAVREAYDEAPPREKGHHRGGSRLVRVGGLFDGGVVYDDGEWFAVVETEEHDYDYNYPLEFGCEALEDELSAYEVLICLHSGLIKYVATTFHCAMNRPSQKVSGWNWSKTDQPYSATPAWDWLKDQGWTGREVSLSGLKSFLLEIERRFVKPGYILVSLDAEDKGLQLLLIEEAKFAKIKRYAEATSFASSIRRIRDL